MIWMLKTLKQLICLLLWRQNKHTLYQINVTLSRIEGSWTLFGKIVQDLPGNVQDYTPGVPYALSRIILDCYGFISNFEYFDIS